MKASREDMLHLSKAQVDYLLGYRKETSRIVHNVLEGTEGKEVGVEDVHNRLDDLGLDEHRLTDAKKMVRVMAITLNDTAEQEEMLEKIRKLGRKPLSEVIINPHKKD